MGHLHEKLKDDGLFTWKTGGNMGRLHEKQ